MKKYDWSGINHLNRYYTFLSSGRALQRGRLSEADALFNESSDLDLDGFPSESRAAALESAFLWVSKINSAAAQEVIRRNKKHFNFFIPQEAFLYIKVMKIKRLFFLIKPLEALHEFARLFRKQKSQL